MPEDKLIPALNVDAFAEGYFAKSASLGVSPEEALGVFMVKRAGGLLTGALIPVALAGIPAAAWGLSGLLSAPSYAVDQLHNVKDLGMMGVGAGAGIGGLAWLLKENARMEAAKKLAGQPSGDKVQKQREDLQKAFAPAQEEKVKPYTTVGQTDYEV